MIITLYACFEITMYELIKAGADREKLHVYSVIHIDLIRIRNKYLANIETNICWMLFTQLIVQKKKERNITSHLHHHNKRMRETLSLSIENSIDYHRKMLFTEFK